jgi:hypothetical protein
LFGVGIAVAKRQSFVFPGQCRVRAGMPSGAASNQEAAMSEASRLRAQKAYSTDPEYLERMALKAEAREALMPRDEAKTKLDRGPAHHHDDHG